MALIICPDCSGKVSDSAPTCPHCGRPLTVNAGPADAAASGSAPMIGTSEPAEKSKDRYLIGIVVTVAIALVFAAAMTPQLKQPHDPVIKAALNYLDTLVIVANKESGDLRNCMITIRANDDYRLRGVDITANGSQMFDAQLFTNLDSERFNPYKYKPTAIGIECETENGKRSGGRELE